jgi:hypothetical protein
MWLKIDQEMEALGSYNLVWNFLKKDYIWLVGPQGHLICTHFYSDLMREFGGDLEIT